MTPVIECNTLTKAYGHIKAVNQLSMVIEENTITGLIGRNGAGNELPIRQFLGVAEKEYDNTHEMNFALYLEIPKNVQVNGLDYGVIDVKEEKK